MTLHDKSDYETELEKQYVTPYSRYWNTFNFLPIPKRKNYSDQEIIFELEIKQRRIKQYEETAQDR